MINIIGAYTDDTYATTATITIPYRGEIMNHDYIGSFWQCQISQKLLYQATVCSVNLGNSLCQIQLKLHGNSTTDHIESNTHLKRNGSRLTTMIYFPLFN